MGPGAYRIDLPEGRVIVVTGSQLWMFMAAAILLAPFAYLASGANLGR